MIELDRMLLRNCRVATMNGHQPEATAVLISGNRIVGVEGDDFAARFGPDCRSIDLEGATILPGFIDAHCHLRGLGQTLSWIDCSFTFVKSIWQMTALMADQKPAKGWIIARGYDQNRLLERRHPVAADLDSVSLDRPVVVIHSSGHGCSINTAALHLLGITRATSDPRGGMIERTSSGEPTGRLLETAINLVWSALPRPTVEERAAAISAGSRYAAEMGITSTVEASADFDDLAAFKTASQHGGLRTRCSVWLLADHLSCRDWPTPQYLAPDDEGSLITVDTAKIFVDGAIGTRTALLREPYADEAANYGTAIWSDRQLDDLVRGAATTGWRIAAHAIGDLAIDKILAAYTKLNVDARVRRHRVEHAMVLHVDQIEQMRRLNVHPVFQPEFISRFGDMYIEALGERAKHIKPYRDVLDAGLILSFSSDMPVVSGRPLDGIASAVSRMSHSGNLLGEDQRLSIVEALRAYTIGAAYAEGCAGRRGMIARDMLADLTILSDSPLDIPIKEWGKIRTVATIVDGRFVCDPNGLDNA